MIRSAYGTEAPPAGETSRLDLRAYDAVLRLLDELDGFAALGGEATPEDVLAALEHGQVRLAGAGERRARRGARPAPCPHTAVRGRLPARPRGGSAAPPQRVSPFLDDDARRALGGRLERPDQVSRDRYLFYTACTRATRRLYLVREAATDDGGPARAEPVLGRGRVAVRRGGRRPGDHAPAAVGAHLVARRRADRPRASARACPARRRRLTTPPVRSPTRTAGNGGSTRARTAFDRQHAARERRGARLAAREDHVRGDRARALRRLLVGAGWSSASSRRRRSTPSRRRDARAARSRTARCTSSTRDCRKSSVTTGSRRRTSSGQSDSCAAASTMRCAAAFGST